MARAEDYEHLPMEQHRLEWKLGRKKVGFDIFVHPNESGRIIINCPGARGTIDGFNNKHKKLAQYMQGEGLGAVVRLPGIMHNYVVDFPIEFPFTQTLEYSLRNAKAISGVDNPEVFLIGTSAGGGVATVVASEHKEVSKILLMAPAFDPGFDLVSESLKKYKGELYVVIGKNDEIVGMQSGINFHRLAVSARHKEIFKIPNCNHNFAGELNGKIMSQAPFYAFAKGEKPKFPDPNGGIILY